MAKTRILSFFSHVRLKMDLERGQQTTANTDLIVPHAYRLYKWRFVGLLALVSIPRTWLSLFLHLFGFSQMLVNIGGGLNATWFGPIAIDSK
jgi:hypothetical protein